MHFYVLDHDAIFLSEEVCQVKPLNCVEYRKRADDFCVEASGCG